MSDFEDRLAALDPAAGQSYQHRDLDELVSRITAKPLVRKQRLWRKIELKLAGTLITGALVTAGSVALFQGGGALPVLAIQGAIGATTPKSFSSSASGAMQIYEKFNFTAGPRLSATTPSSPSYQLQLPRDAAREAARIAAIFRVTGSPVNTAGDGTDWLVTSPSGTTLDYATAGVPQWTYNAPTSTSNSSATSLPSHSTLTSDVQQYMAKLGYGYTLAAPSFGTTSSSSSGAPSVMSTADVSFTVDVTGTSTDQTVNFSVDTNNNVVSASGPAFDVGVATNYPLESLSAGVSSLNALQQSRFPGAASVGSSGSGPSTSSGVNPGGSNTTTQTPAGPPVANVVLDSYSIALQTYQLTDGSLWLLPMYNYTGTETRADGSTSTGTWSELAVDPSYVHVSGPGSSHGVINY